MPRLSVRAVRVGVPMSQYEQQTSRINKFETWLTAYMYALKSLDAMTSCSHLKYLNSSARDLPAFQSSAHRFGISSCQRIICPRVANASPDYIVHIDYTLYGARC